MPVHTTPIGPIEVLEWGDGPELLVLLHAAAAGPGSVTGLARALERPGRRIVAPALHAYGATAVAVAGDRFDAHVAVAGAVLDRYPADRRVLFGHSMGGLVALLAQIPVDAMVLYEPIVLGLLRDDDPDDVAARAWDHAIVAELAERVAAGDPEAGVRRFVEAWNELRWDGLPQSVRVRLIAAAPALADEIRAGSSHAVQPEAVRWPTLILQGTLSPPVTARMTARLAAAVPVSVRRMMDGCGHMGPVQAPAQVAPAIRSFIDG